MDSVGQARWIRKVLVCSLVVIGLLIATTGFAADVQTTKPFSGVKVNGGTATHSKNGGRHVLTLSDDFKVPDTPDPHWQVVDSRGTVYLTSRTARTRRVASSPSWTMAAIWWPSNGWITHLLPARTSPSERRGRLRCSGARPKSSKTSSRMAVPRWWRFRILRRYRVVCQSSSRSRSSAVLE